MVQTCLTSEQIVRIRIKELEELIQKIIDSTDMSSATKERKIKTLKFTLATNQIIYERLTGMMLQ